MGFSISVVHVCPKIMEKRIISIIFETELTFGLIFGQNGIIFSTRHIIDSKSLLKSPKVKATG